MPRFLIKRQIPGLQHMSAQQLHELSAASNGVLSDLQQKGRDIQWDHSYVSDDTLHCVYIAQDTETVREHARCGGFPCNEVMPVHTMIDPTTGESP